jgi:hypothetical protein
MRWSTFLSTLSSAALVAAAPPAEKKPAPDSCKVLPGDANWPSEETWKSELKGAEYRGAQQKWTAPDYAYEASRVTHVQNAVKFAAKHSIRLSIINSGHDFIGRYVVKHFN